jgi:hypothetical protein
MKVVDTKAFLLAEQMQGILVRNVVQHALTRMQLPWRRRHSHAYLTTPVAINERRSP